VGVALREGWLPHWSGAVWSCLEWSCLDYRSLLHGPTSDRGRCDRGAHNPVTLPDTSQYTPGQSDDAAAQPWYPSCRASSRSSSLSAAARHVRRLHRWRCMRAGDAKPVHVSKAARGRAAFPPLVASYKPALRGQSPEPCMSRRRTRQAGACPAAAAVLSRGALWRALRAFVLERCWACSHATRSSYGSLRTFVLAVRGGGAAGGAATGLQVGAPGRTVHSVPSVAAAHPVRAGQAALAAGQRQHLRRGRGRQLLHAGGAASGRVAHSATMLAERGRPAGRGERWLRS
jgi:hypothetical protein